MPTTVKDMLTPARAAVPAITPAEAADLVKTADALIVDVRDGTEVAASGKVKGTKAISRGLLEFKADAALPTHDAALRKDRPVILYCGSGRRAALAGKRRLRWATQTRGTSANLRDWWMPGGQKLEECDPAKALERAMAF